ncbi:hypothetical protein BD410DRAFT_44110 [Rickenella mellea]|uniref:Uncharacterized protein n=1 Tax=Rickenella mellea TaxID=50990 RepID=A0A4R5XGV0_9AGAM|nr:hypothetical protein BD410DRAFT_44110 [Rickenella mellea]
MRVARRRRSRTHPGPLEVESIPEWGICEGRRWFYRSIGWRCRVNKVGEPMVLTRYVRLFGFVERLLPALSLSYRHDLLLAIAFIMALVPRTRKGAVQCAYSYQWRMSVCNSAVFPIHQMFVF